MDHDYALVGGAVAVGAVSLWYLLSQGELPSKVRSKEHGYSCSGQYGAPRRHPSSFSKLRTSNPQYSSLFDIIRLSKAKYGDSPAMGTRSIIKVHAEKKMVEGVEKTWYFNELSSYKWKTYSEVYDRAVAFGAGLKSLGLNKGDRVGIYEETREEWTTTALGSFSQGIVVVTVYANLGEEGLEHALKECELEFLLTNGKLVKNLSRISESCPRLKTLIYTDKVDEAVRKEAEAKGLNLISFEEVVEKGLAAPSEPSPSTIDDMAVIMYTSGTTGPPKGVMITNRNILATFEGVRPRAGLCSSDVYISYLPLAHVLALVSELCLLECGASIGYANPRSLLDASVRNCLGDLKALRPTVMAGVPTVWDRVRKGALAKLDKASPIAKTLFNYCYAKKEAALKRGSDTPLANALIFRKFKETLGGRIRLIVSGGAPLSAETHTFLRVCFGVPIMQGYGLTETCGGGTLQEPDEVTTLRSGPPLLCCELRLDDVPDMGYTSNDQPCPRGEICIRGDNVTLGYYKNEAKTKEDFVDGWFRTGDIGVWKEDGTIAIIDRKKNLVKLSHGEYIALEKLESIYKTCPFVENVMVYGDSYQTFPVALVYASEDRVKEWAAANGASGEDYSALIQNKSLIKDILSQMGTAGRKAGLKNFEIVRGVYLCPEEWTPENDYLTAAMKIKRRTLIAAFRDNIDGLYS